MSTIAAMIRLALVGIMLLGVGSQAIQQKALRGGVTKVGVGTLSIFCSPISSLGAKPYVMKRFRWFIHDHIDVMFCPCVGIREISTCTKAILRSIYSIYVI